ncbi:hypothetical protein [Microscilla marina]|uniref:Uncharacterized protein n=1 Tax=Microscilla marina ATCC 23134 TaxID=313606 RepID=A1ZZX8_MICM2|nr:hypothetical protein [Microscilla marina]EAY24066.1 hypothetical protein M23134_01550 [Microscilla marina ATCC 23134]
MNNKKKNKLTIKENWSKGLTLSEKEKSFLIGGGTGADCPTQNAGKSEATNQSHGADGCVPD